MSSYEEGEVVDAVVPLHLGNSFTDNRLDVSDKHCPRIVPTIPYLLATNSGDENRSNTVKIRKTGKTFVVVSSPPSDEIGPPFHSLSYLDRFHLNLNQSPFSKRNLWQSSSEATECFFDIKRWHEPNCSTSDGDGVDHCTSLSPHVQHVSLDSNRCI